MANIINLRCHHCGELLQNREEPYCPECNLYLAYRAMPFLLGMLLLGHPVPHPVEHYPQGRAAVGGDAFAYEDEAVLIWE
ncbi:MAG: hypothetical protein FIB02_12855 [Desulfuromonas sp.]|nr:hypothetical protein [Desulfuromonas sp.]